jgi:hypothetical protein
MKAVMSEDSNARKAILDRLAQSREEMRRILDPPRSEFNRSEATQNSGAEFPRSRTMRALLSGGGLGTLGALASGLLIARPALALRLLRMVPVSTVGKMLIAKVITGLRAKHEP